MYSGVSDHTRLISQGYIFGSIWPHSINTTSTCTSIGGVWPLNINTTCIGGVSDHATMTWTRNYTGILIINYQKELDKQYTHLIETLTYSVYTCIRHTSARTFWMMTLFFTQCTFWMMTFCFTQCSLCRNSGSHEQIREG